MELLLYLLTLFLKVCQKFLARDGVSKLKRLSELYIEILNKLKLIVFVDIQLYNWTFVLNIVLIRRRRSRRITAQFLM